MCLNVYVNGIAKRGREDWIEGRQIGYTEADFEGVRRLVAVAIGADGEPSIIGYTTLEILELKVNLVTICRTLSSSLPEDCVPK